MPKILYLHGLHSRPGGVKPTFLCNAGYDVINPALPDDDFAESVRRAQDDFDRHHLDVIVGSSRGGAVALAVRSGDVPVILIAPAWRRCGTATRAPRNTIILHSAADEVIPLADSRALVAASGLPDHALEIVGADHNMIDPPALVALRSAVDKASRPTPRAESG